MLRRYSRFFSLMLLSHPVSSRETVRTVSAKIGSERRVSFRESPKTHKKIRRTLSSALRRYKNLLIRHAQSDAPPFLRPGGTGGRGVVFRRVCRKRQAVLMAAAFLVEKRNMERHHLSQSKYEAMTFATACNAERRCYKRLNGRKNCIGKGFAVQFIAEKRNVARRFLVRNEIWKGYPLLRNGIGRAALRR